MEKSLTCLVTQDGSAVPAELWDDISADHVELWIDSWKPEMDRLRQQLEQKKVPREKWPQDLHWDWSKKADATRPMLAFKRLALTCEGRLQGLMLANLVIATAHLAEQQGKPLVYVDFISTAPWNRPDFCDKPRFTGVGSILIRAAVELSQSEGFRGRIGLHSLPQAEGFYQTACGMTSLGADVTYQNLTYFEMTEHQAVNLLNRPPKK